MCITEDDGAQTKCGREECRDNGRKMGMENENPIDVHIVNLCEVAAELIRANDPNKTITPNMLTTIGLISGVVAILLLLKKQYVGAFIMIWVYYFFDCLDGYYARRYNMVTQAGDYYDHIRDILINIPICFIIYKQLKTDEDRAKFIIIFSVLLVLMLTHFGCQEIFSRDQENNRSIHILRSLINEKEYINCTKYFGGGTFILATSLSILYLGL